MTSFNITKFGHYNDEINSDEKYLIDLLSRKFKVKFSKQINLNEINILFEGHQKTNHEKVIERLKKSNMKKILVMTEDLVGEDNINFKYFTINSDKLSFKKFIKKKSIKYDLYFDFFLYEMSKFKLFNFFFRIIGKFKFLQKNNIYDLRNYWRERYYLLIDQLNYIDEVWFLRENNLGFYKSILESKNIKNRVIFYRIISLTKNMNKNIDILVTGTLNNYRKSIVDELSKKFKLEYHSFLNSLELEEKLKSSKYYLILNKSHYGIFPSSSRMKIALENDCIPLNQKTIFSDYLNIHSHTIDNLNDPKKIEKIIQNYEEIYQRIFTNLKIAISEKDYFQFLDDL